MAANNCFNAWSRRLHDAVLVQPQTDPVREFAVSRVAGIERARRDRQALSDFVAPEYVELVDSNLRRRLLGEPAAERYEVELTGAHGEVTRVELSSTVIDSAGEDGVVAHRFGDAAGSIEWGAAAGAAASRGRPRRHGRKRPLRSMPPGGSITSNTSAETLLGQRFDQVAGKSFPEVASLGMKRTAVRSEIRFAWR